MEQENNAIKKLRTAEQYNTKQWTA